MEIACAGLSVLNQCERVSYNYLDMEDNYVRLAKLAVRRAVTGGEVDEGELEELRGALPESPRGVFVTLKKDGMLRGCIGTYHPSTDSLAGEILRNGSSAALDDPRFPSVSPDELEDISISVDVLSEPEECARDELNPNKYGILLEKGMRSGLLLPDLDGVESVDEQIDITKRKAGIPPGDENYTVKRFTVERHHGEKPVGK
ncbi:AmmeMemoRadiSam system protein A [Candidatus Bipolaricaulota bacterium]|nr:AmmeMemoRadiSam system protein A [Candidatus Bipolaricaulota bacterium]